MIGIIFIVCMRCCTMEHVEATPRMNCAVDATMSVIEGRWKTVIMCLLLRNGPMRFNQLMRSIDGVSPRILTKQLKEMESDGIILRTSYPEIPPRVEYSVTERGESLAPILKAMAEWGLRNMFQNRVSFDPEIRMED